MLDRRNAVAFDQPDLVSFSLSPRNSNLMDHPLTIYQTHPESLNVRNRERVLRHRNSSSFPPACIQIRNP